MDHEEQLLLAVLNSAPILGGERRDQLEGVEAETFTKAWGGTGSAVETATLRQARDALHSVIRTSDLAALEVLSGILTEVTKTPTATGDGLSWELQSPADVRLAARVLCAWSEVVRRLPGRLRACANEECNLFLIDHSRPGTARWCSMAACGNRAKARSFAARSRAETQAHGTSAPSAAGRTQ